MKTQQDQENASPVIQQKGNKQASAFKDERPETVAQGKLYDMVNRSQQVTQMQSLQRMVDNRVQNAPFDPIQRKENKTGLPDNLKTGVENLSGHSMDDVKVHYNSPKPAQLKAHAYAQGTDIHVASGQEKHLPHEAWHVVQQKQGRVKPTMQMKGKVNVNDDSGLEREADVMGAKANNLSSRLPGSSEINKSGQLLGQSDKVNQLALISGVPVQQFKGGCGSGGTDNQPSIDEVFDEGRYEYKDLLVKGAHYDGENINSALNPIIVDGRKGVLTLKSMKFTDEQIIEHLRKPDFLPNFTPDEVQKYFIDGDMPKVDYVNEERRANYQLNINGGTIKQGIPEKKFDTSNMFSSGAGAGFSVFVMSPGGTLFANEHKPGLFHHSSFLEGLPTAGAGELEVKGGKLKRLTNKSGHYHPGARHTYQVLTQLQMQGVKLSSFKLTIKSSLEEKGVDYNKEWKTARAFYNVYSQSLVD
jgi:hypothetical protein